MFPSVTFFFSTAEADPQLFEVKPLKFWKNHFRETSQSSSERRDKQLSDGRMKRFGAGMDREERGTRKDEDARLSGLKMQGKSGEGNKEVKGRIEKLRK